MSKTREEIGRVGILMGGCSSERSISLKSGKAIFKALVDENFDVLPIDIDTDNAQDISALIKSKNIQLAFIALHGQQGEDGTMQSILKKLNIPYTGSDEQSSGLAFDKCVTQELLKKNGLMVAPFQTMLNNNKKTIDALMAEIDFWPVVVKPATEGSSYGISIVKTQDAFEEAVQLAARYTKKILVEKYIKGRELTVGILNNEALAVVEIKPKNEYFDFQSKYSKGYCEYDVPAPLSESLTIQMQQAALKAHQVLGCRHFSRVDFMLDENNQFYILELNTIPGFTETSLLPKSAAIKGLSFNQLAVEIVELAYGQKKEGKQITARA